MPEYRALINTIVSIHKMNGNELREVIPLDTMNSHGVKQKSVIMIDGDSEHHVLDKVRKWLNQE